MNLIKILLVVAVGLLLLVIGSVSLLGFLGQEMPNTSVSAQ